jgi:hypothetical protein
VLAKGEELKKTEMQGRVLKEELNAASQKPKAKSQKPKALRLQPSGISRL